MRLRIGLLWLLCLLSTVWADDVGQPVTGEAQTAFLTAWSARLQRMQALHMVFTQEKQLRVLRQPLTTQGELWLQGERLLYRLTTPAGETEMVVALDPQRLRTYYPRLQTVEVLDLQNARALPQSVPVCHASPEALARDYTIELFRNDADVYTLRLLPKDASNPLQEMQLELRALQPQAVVQVDKNGTRVRMQVRTFTLNPDISAAHVELQVPEGTKVVPLLK